MTNPRRRASDRISLRRLGWMATVLTGATLPHWPVLPIWIPLLLATSIAWRISASLLNIPLPNRAIRVLLAISAFSGVLLQYQTINGLNAGSALLVVMVALKFLESQSQRDQLVLMLISYFLVFSGLLYETSALSGIYLIVFIWMTTIGLLQLGRRGDLMQAVPTARLAGKLLLQAAPLMVVLFVLFPRLPGPLWTMASGATNGTTGLSDSMGPGDITSLGLSDEIAFRVDFLDGQASTADLYWRGPVLAIFDGRTWRRRNGMWGNAYENLLFSGEPVRYRVTMESPGTTWALALEMPYEWTSTRRQNIVMQSDYQLRAFASRSVDSRLSYEVTSYTSFVAGERLDQTQRDYYLTLPEGFNPETRDLMAEIAAASESTDDVVARTLEYFGNEEFFYTLTPPPLGRHSVDDFVFRTREGFCEHYASAFTFMMRLAGIPARVVTGYQGGELNPFAEYYIVRESNAHAWTEVWLEDRGWVRVDPVAAVAPERISLGLSDSSILGTSDASALGRLSMVRQIALAWDAVNTYWNRWVIGYGPALQRSILEKFGFERLSWGEMLSIAILAAVAVLLAIGGWLAYVARTRMHLDPAERSFKVFSAVATRKGVAPRQPYEGPVAYGRRVCAALPSTKQRVGDIVKAYLSARYERDPQKQNLHRLQALVADFKRWRQSAARA